MNIFIIHRSIARQYTALQNKIRYNKQLIEYAKAGGVILVFLFFLGVYIYYINKASTLGYFYRNEQKKRDQAEFQFNIQAFETTKVYETLWDQIMTWSKYLGTDSKNFTLKESVYSIE